MEVLVKNRGCVSDDHCYDTVIKGKQIDYEKKGKAYSFNIAQAILCSKCGNILFPEYPDKFSAEELERIADIRTKELDKEIGKQLAKRKRK